MVATGNDFVVVEKKSQKLNFKKLALKLCDRKFGLGADGLLILDKSKSVDIRMRIFNADGSEAKMCGNGARCVALYTSRRIAKNKSRISIETQAGVIVSEVAGDNVKIKLTEPKNLKLDLPVKVGARTLRVNFINTGVPHAVIFTEGLDKISVFNLGRQIRHHRAFVPAGTNVDFVEALSNRSINLRTYERGVEDETLACGTGAVASALVFSLKTKKIISGRYAVDVKTRSGQMLKVYFEKINDKFTNTWLQGQAKIVAEGVYYV